MNLDPFTLGDCLTFLILLTASAINWKIFRIYYKSEVKPRGRYYFVLGLLLLAILHEGVEALAGLSGSIQVFVPSQIFYILYVVLKSLGPVVIFYASLVMYKEAKMFAGP